MDIEQVDWNAWSDFFAARSERPLPDLASAEEHTDLPPSLARSLAIFQLGESGGGTVVEQARAGEVPAADADYAEALQFFVQEEHRHANILAWCVRVLRGRIIRKNWTAKLFVAARRLMGLRFKVLVLLAAEVVGICYYHLLATRLPACQIKSLLAELVNDERSHLLFHCDFLRMQVRNSWQRRLFVFTWRATMCVAAAVVLLDHRTALRDLGIDKRTVWRRWTTYSRHAEWLITSPSLRLSRPNRAQLRRDRGSEADLYPCVY